MTRPLLGLGVVACVIPLATVVSHSFGRATYPLLLPAIRDDVLGSNTQAGVGGMVIYLGYLSGVLVVSWVALRFEPIAILRVGVGTAAVGLAVLAVANGLLTVSIGLFLASGAGAGIWLTAPTITTQDVPLERRGFAIGILSGAIGLGTAVVSAGTWMLRRGADDDGLWRPVFAVEAIATALILLLISAVVRSRSSSADGSGGFSMVAMRSLPRWFRLTAAYVCFGMIAAGYSSFLAAALEDDVGLSRSAISVIYILLGLASVVGAPGMGLVSDRIGRRTAMIGVMSMMGVGSLIVAFGDTWLVVIGVVLFGGMWGSYPTLTATYVRDHLDSRAFSSAFATMTIFYSFAAILPPLLAGSIADRLGSFTLVYVAMGVVAALGVVLAWGVPDEKPNTPAAGKRVRFGQF